MRFDRWLGEALARWRSEGEGRDPGLGIVLDSLTAFSLRPGKRLRPFLVHAAYTAGGGQRQDEECMPVAAAAEMLHVFALAHDDIIDDSEYRRGLPAVHREWDEWHQQQGLRGSPARFGASAGLLIGDLALALSDRLLDSAEIPHDRARALREVWNTMREEVIEGQFLDVLASSRQAPAPEEAIWSILSLKSGKYTLERPLHLGAVAAGAGEDMLAAFSAFGIPLGRAFQIQDDILGLFGDADAIGKSVESDVREGKSTLLISRAYAVACDEDRALLASVWGNPRASPADVDRVRAIVTATGARAYAEQQARTLLAEALDALDSAPVPADSRSLLAALAWFVLDRRS